MNNKQFWIVIAVIFVIGIIIITAMLTDSNNNIKTETVTLMDTIYEYKTDTIEIPNIEINKLQQENDSLREQLFIINYKLERIKYYNSIASKGNNIKYLRGWINRVLNE